MKQQFVDHLRGYFQENLEGISPLQRAIREKAWDRFLEVGLPEKHHSGYQYFPRNQFFQERFELAPLPTIPKEQIESLIYPNCRQSHVLFVNGQYVPELSDISGLPDSLVMIRLRDALNTYGNFLQGRLSKCLREETDPFVLLNMAMIQMGLFLYLPPKVVVERPIQCLHIISNEKPVIFNPRIHFFLGAHSKLTWFYDQHCLKDFESMSNVVVDVALEEGAHFEQFGVLNPCKHGWHFEATRAILKRDSHFSSLTCNSGSKSVREDYRIVLMGENASCDLKGVSTLYENRQAHVNVYIDHQAPRCQSNQLFKNILTDTSRCSFEGKIYVHPKAQKTQAYQLNNNLILTDKAIANSKPNLEIFADDVKASHGCTTTTLNEQHLFYLRSRGIGPQEGKKLLLSSFCTDVWKEVPYLPLRDRMHAFAERAIQ